MADQKKDTAKQHLRLNEANMGRFLCPINMETAVLIYNMFLICRSTLEESYCNGCLNDFQGGWLSFMEALSARMKEEQSVKPPLTDEEVKEKIKHELTQEAYSHLLQVSDPDKMGKA